MFTFWKGIQRLLQVNGYRLWVSVGRRGVSVRHGVSAGFSIVKFKLR